MSAYLNLGSVRLRDAETIEIASGVIAPSRENVIVQAVSPDTTDDLDTINLTNFDMLSVNSITYRPLLCITADAGDTITLKHGTGNITLPSDTDIALTDGEFYWLKWNGTAWQGHAGGGSGGSGTVTSVDLSTDVGILTVAGNPITTSGTITLNKTSGLTANQVLASPDGTTGVVSMRSLVLDDLPDQSLPVECRLTLSSTLAVPTGNLTAQTTLYCLPYKGNRIALYDGSADHNTYELGASGISIAIPSSTNTNYDIFIYDNSGTLTLEAVAWSSDSTRATALVYIAGREVKSGETTKLYLGTIRTTGVSGQCETSFTGTPKWYVDNAYNKVLFTLTRVETTNTWAYATANTVRSANASTANRIEVVRGLNEYEIDVYVKGFVFGGANTYFATGVGVDSTSVNSAQLYGTFATTSAGAVVPAYFRGKIGIGHHYLQWVESQNTSVSSTWVGDGGVAEMQSGMQVRIMA